MRSGGTSPIEESRFLETIQSGSPTVRLPLAKLDPGNQTLKLVGVGIYKQ